MFFREADFLRCSFRLEEVARVRAARFVALEGFDGEVALLRGSFLDFISVDFWS